MGESAVSSQTGYVLGGIFSFSPPLHEASANNESFRESLWLKKAETRGCWQLVTQLTLCAGV